MHKNPIVRIKHKYALKNTPIWSELDASRRLCRYGGKARIKTLAQFLITISVPQIGFREIKF